MRLSSSKSISYVYVTDRARGVAFYRDTLELRHVEADDFGDAFDLGGATMRLTALPDHKPSGHPALGWSVADIAATLRALKAKGIEPLIYEGMGQDADGVWTAPGGRTRLAWFSDPDGNALMLSQD